MIDRKRGGRLARARCSRRGIGARLAPGASFAPRVTALALLAFGLCTLAFPVEARAEGLRFGIRAGYADLDGKLLGGLIRTGEERLFGLQVIFPVVGDHLHLQVAGEGTTDELDLDRDGFSTALGGDVEWSDVALYTSLRLELLPTALVGVYGGAGVGVHITEIDEEELTRVLEETGQTIDSGLRGETSDFEWHGVVGASLDLGSLFELFGEGRYRRVEGDFERDGFAGYAGLNVRLP